MGSGGGDGAGGRSVKLKVQNNPRPDDGFGGEDNAEGAWADKFEAWARMRQMRAGEVWSNRRIESRAMYMFTFDYLAAKTILTTDRLLIGDRAFNVRGIDNVEEMNRTIKVMAEEGVTD